MNRRNLLLSASLLAFSGCSVSKVNGVTTITLNLATVNAYAQAIENAEKILMGIPLIATALGPKAVIITAAVADIASVIQTLDTTYAGQTSFSFDATSVPSAITSLQKDASTILDLFQTAVGGLGSAVSSNVSTVISALQTVVILVSALASVMPTATETPMSASSALAILGVKQ